MFKLKTGIERKDIKEIYPQYEMAGTGGFSYDLDTTKLTNGKHIIKFNFNGIQKEKEIVLKNNAAIVNIESLTDDLKGISPIEGYILSDNNPSIFNLMNCIVYIDGER